MASTIHIEDRPEPHPGRNSLLKSVLIFAMHQVVGTWGIGFTVPYLLASSLDVFALIGHPVSMRWLHWILTETPFFPMQIGFGLYLGYVVARRFKQRSMQWIWILPGFFLFYCVAAVPNLGIMQPRSLAVQIAQESQNPFWHYFGWGCRPKDRCIDQLIVTMPFYASVAYSLGARLSFARQAKNREASLTISSQQSIGVGRERG